MGEQGCRFEVASQLAPASGRTLTETNHWRGTSQCAERAKFCSWKLPSWMLWPRKMSSDRWKIHVLLWHRSHRSWLPNETLSGLRASLLRVAGAEGPTAWQCAFTDCLRLGPVYCFFQKSGPND